MMKPIICTFVIKAGLFDDLSYLYLSSLPAQSFFMIQASVFFIESLHLGENLKFLLRLAFLELLYPTTIVVKSTSVNCMTI